MIPHFLPGLDGSSTNSGEQSVSFHQAMVPSTLFTTGFVMAVHGGAVNPTIMEMYSIALIDLSTGLNNPKVIPEIDDPHGTTPAEFYFTVPPKVIEVGEPYASKIVPTQNGGKFIREIRIQGNSGLRPNKSLPASLDLLGGATFLGPLAGPVNSLAGPIINRGQAIADSVGDVISAFKSGPSRNLKDSEYTGYDDMMKLRNIFRHYSDVKALGESTSSRLAMVWRNIKDADYWVVEPREFKLMQDSKSPMTYTYNISLRTISRFTFNHTASTDRLAALKNGANQIATIQKAIRTITTSLFVVAGSIDRLSAAGVFAQNLLVEPMIAIINGTTAVINSVNGISVSTSNNWKRLNDNTQEAIDRLDAAFNPGVGAVGPNVQVSQQNLSQEEQENAESYALIINTLRQVQRVARNVLIQPTLQDSLGARVSDRLARQTASYQKPLIGGLSQGVSPDTAGDSSFIGNENSFGSVERAIVEHGETIFSLAQRLLGQRNRWKILVNINDLKPPYITTSREPQTLAPGDYILYPVTGGGGIRTTTINSDVTGKEQKGENPDSVVDRAYGRDIRLTSDFNNRTDFVVDKGGDLATIQGVANVKQGIRLKLSTEQGTLTVHPFYGAAFPIGTKMTPISFNLFRLNTHATIISDPRISKVKKLEFFARGDTLSLGAELILKHRADVTTTTFEIRQ
jgi:hypothetical protein